MEFASELQRQRVLIRWKKQREIEHLQSITNKTIRSILLARLIGYIQGDGCIGKYYDTNNKRYHYNIMFYPDNYKVAELFVDTFHKLYGRRTNITILKNYFRILVCHRVAYDDLTKYTTFNSLDWRAPVNLLNDTSEKIEWLRALFDCEAYVGKRAIVMNSVNQTGLREVQKFLQDFGISTRWYEYHRKQKTWNTNYILVIGRKLDRQNFLNQIGFNHPIKKAKLESQFATVA